MEMMPQRKQKPTARRFRRIKWAVRIAALALIIGCPTIVGCDSWFYYPSRIVYDQPVDYGLAHEEVTFKTADGLMLHGWFLPAQTAPRGIVVHFHGNAANVTAHVALVAWLPPAGYHVLMFDYRGYGRSEGRVNRAGTIRDGHAAVDYALTRPEAERLPLLAYGQSLGGAVAVVVAAERPELRAVVAESPFDSYRHIAARHARQLLFSDALGRAVARLTVSAGHDPIDVVQKRSPRPLLVIAAERDTICYPELARALYDAAREPKDFWIAPGSEHLSITTDHTGELLERVRRCFALASEE